jgi:hypothetical protein
MPQIEKASVSTTRAEQHPASQDHADDLVHLLIVQGFGKAILQLPAMPL